MMRKASLLQFDDGDQLFRRKKMMKNQKTTHLIADSNKMDKYAASLISLPGEIIIDILSRLPVDSVIQCKHVCKTWRSLVDNDPTFVDLHTHQIIKSGSSADPFCFLLFLFVRQQNHLFSRTTNYRLHFGEYHDDDDDNDNDEYIDDANKKKKNIFFNHMKLSGKPNYPFHQCNKVKRISSCNGLILIGSISSHCNNMMVLNPVTREYVYLPPSGEEEEEDHHELLFGSLIWTGFGYHPFTNEYKVVRIKYPRHREEGVDGYIYVYIYTLGSGRGGWRRIRKVKVDLKFSFSCYMFGYSGVVLNGALHWIGIEGSSVLSLDLGDEELKILPSPPLEDTESWGCIDHQLGVFQGCLCLSRNKHSTTDLWVLMNKDEKEKEWTKKFSISAVDSGVLCRKYRFLAALESGRFLFFSSSSLEIGKSRLHLVSYDPETGSIHDEGENFCGHLNGCVLTNMIPYVKSFVSLKALGEETALKMCR